MRIFAVTYTYNDAALLDALLAELARWSVRPHALLAVDDASASPYVFPSKAESALAGLELNVLRLAANAGPVGAKRAGMDAAAASGAEVILSLDADIRPQRDWLARALPYLADPGIGLVGARFAPGPGEDSLSRYLRAFFTPPPLDEETPFLGAGLWLIRRDTWLSVGGFGDFNEKTHEDLYFCLKLHAAKLRMLAVNSKPVCQARVLRRLDYLRRELAYLGPGFRKSAEDKGLAAALRPLVEQAAKRLDLIAENGDADFLYLEIIKYAAFLARLQAEPSGGQNAFLAKELLADGFRSLQAYPNIFALLRRDLSDLGFAALLPEISASAASDAFAARPVPFLGLEYPRKLLLKLELSGVRNLVQEDRKLAFDKHYLAAQAGPPENSVL